MAEYIDREEYCEKHCRCSNEYCDKESCPIWKAPAADVAPVVHCRHCRSYNKPRLGWCSVHLDREGPDDFCGYGARMDGGACNQVCKYNTPDRGCVAGELRARCDLANVAGERGNGEAG